MLPNFMEHFFLLSGNMHVQPSYIFRTIYDRFLWNGNKIYDLVNFLRFFMKHPPDLEGLKRGD